jgi:growth arrest-specific protein 8
MAGGDSRAGTEGGRLLVTQDTVNNFYEIVKREVKEYEMAVMAKDREMELMEENHRVEVRVRWRLSWTWWEQATDDLISGLNPIYLRPPCEQVYIQKVKHLEYEHKHSIKGITNEGRQLLHDEVRGPAPRPLSPAPGCPP